VKRRSLKQLASLSKLKAVVPIERYAPGQAAICRET